MLIMLQKWSEYSTLEQFFDFPRKSFLIRGLSRKTNLAQTSIKVHLERLESEGLLKKDDTGIYPAYKANVENPSFRLLKSQNIVLRLNQAGVIGAIEKKAYPNCIVLFGSGARGEDNENSDIDLFVQSKKHDIDLSKPEKSVNRKINILYEPNLKTLGPELLNNIVNGYVLYGYLKVF